MQEEWDTEDVTLDFVFDNGLNRLLVDLENSTQILEDYIEKILDAYILITILVLNLIIMIGILVLGSASFYNTVTYKKTVYRFLEAFLKMKPNRIEAL